MSIAAAELLMLGSSAASASCCLAVPARTTSRERALAVAMVSLMGVLVIDTPNWVQYGLLGTVVLLTASLAIRTSVADDHTIDWHRAAGAALMILFALLHLHLAEGAGTHEHGSTDAAHIVPDHDVLLLHLLQTWTVAYAVWTGVVVLRLNRMAGTGWLRWEHASMALGVLTMAFLMT